ncbi:hypothetical protein ACVWW1_001016 [Bradyrhizobium sp. JR3.5]
MRGRIGNQWRKKRCVEHQHGAGDPGHAAGHHQKQFAAGELRQIGADEERGFHHAEEDVGGGGKPDRAADTERAFQHPGHAAHDRRQHAPIEQQRRQHAHDKHDRQRLEGEDEIRTRHLGIERRRAAADIAEHKGGAGACRGRDGADGIVDRAEGLRHQRHLDQHQRGDDRDDEPDRRLPQRHLQAILAQRPGDHEQRHHAERRLQLQHHAPKNLRAIMSRGPTQRNAVTRSSRIH